MRADANRAVKPDPDPEWGSASSKRRGVFSPGSDLTAFLFSTPSRRDGRALAVASRGHLYYGIDAEIEGRVAKIAP